MCFLGDFFENFVQEIFVILIINFFVDMLMFVNRVQRKSVSMVGVEVGIFIFVQDCFFKEEFFIFSYCNFLMFIELIYMIVLKFILVVVY